MKYTLVLHDEAGRVVSSRNFTFKFDGPRPDFSTGYEEYSLSLKAREMWRDAAHAVGKFRPWMNKDQANAK